MTGQVPGKWWEEADGLHIDTRGLSPPEPLVAVLWHIGQPGRKGPVTAHFDRNPVYLFPELEEHGWSYEYATVEPNYVRLILRAKA